MVKNQLALHIVMFYAVSKKYLKVSISPFFVISTENKDYHHHQKTKQNKQTEKID